MARPSAGRPAPRRRRRELRALRRPLASPHGRPDPAKALTLAAVLIGAGACLALNWPGHFSYDSVVQLAEGRTGVYQGGHPPVMSWLLGAADALAPGAVLFVILQLALIAGGLMAFAGLARAPPWWTPLLALALAPLPQLLIYPAIVWKDVLFAGAASSGFACLAHALARWDRPWARRALLAGAALFLALASLTRQNGALVLPFAIAALAFGAPWAFQGRGRGGPMGENRGRRLSGLAHGLAVALAAGAICLAVSAALAPRVETEANSGDASGGQWRGLKTWDIVSALSLAPATDLPVLREKAPWLERLLRTKGVAAFSPAKADTLEPVLEEALDVSDGRADVTALIGAQWRDLLLRHPGLYLRARARSLAWVLLTPDPAACVLVFTGVDGPTDEMGDARLAYRRTALDDGLAEYALGLAGTPAYSHAAYGALGLVLAAFLLWRRRPEDLAVAALLGAMLAFAASFALISVACDYRYLYPLDLAVIAAALYAAATARARSGT